MNKIDAEVLYQKLISMKEEADSIGDMGGALMAAKVMKLVGQMSATVSLEKQIRDDAKWVQHMKVQREIREKKYREWEADM